MHSKPKTIPSTMRVTQSQHDELKRLAKEQHQSVSQYGVEHIFQGSGVTDTQRRQVFWALTKIRDAIEFQPEAGQDFKTVILQECDAIWQSLSL